MSDQATVSDVLVIGMGPVGLYQIFQLGLLGLRVAAVDSLPQPGGQCRALYADRTIYDLPALPQLTGQALSERLWEQTRPFFPELHFAQTAIALRPWQASASASAGGFELQTAAGLTFRARAVVLAAGAGAYQRRPLALAGAEDWLDRQIFVGPTTADRFAAQQVVVVGGGNEAIELCLALVTAGAAGISLVRHRGRFSRFTTDPALVQAVEEQAALGRIRLVTGQPRRLVAGPSVRPADQQTTVDSPDSGSAAERRLEALVLTDSETGQEVFLALDALILCEGQTPTLSPLADWGLPLDGRQLPVDPATMASAVQGLYAVGDVCRYPGKLKLITTGFAEAVRAAHSVAHQLAGRPGVLEYSAVSLRQQRRLGVLTEQMLATRLRPHLHFPDGL